MLRDIDAIAVQLKKFSAAGVPVLWRPLHEAEGQWFWWGAKGPEAFKKLWRLTFQRLTGVHKLHNLIWVYTAGTKMEWYPGDRYVDIVGVDSYPADSSDPLSQIWDDLKKQFDGRKMMALSEFGKVPDIPKMYRLGGRWAYFVSWTGDLGPVGMPKTCCRAVTIIPMSSTTTTSKTDLDRSKFGPWELPDRKFEYSITYGANEEYASRQSGRSVASSWNHYHDVHGHRGVDAHQGTYGRRDQCPARPCVSHPDQRAARCRCTGLRARSGRLRRQPHG
jgi:hypothetical protein